MLRERREASVEGACCARLSASRLSQPTARGSLWHARERAQTSGGSEREGAASKGANIGRLATEGTRHARSEEQSVWLVQGARSEEQGARCRACG